MTAIDMKQRQAVLAVVRDCHDLLTSQKWATGEFSKVYGVLNWLTNLESGIVEEMRSEEAADSQAAAN